MTFALVPVSRNYRVLECCNRTVTEEERLLTWGMHGDVASLGVSPFNQVLTRCWSTAGRSPRAQSRCTMHAKTQRGGSLDAGW